MSARPLIRLLVTSAAAGALVAAPLAVVPAQAANRLRARAPGTNTWKPRNGTAGALTTGTAARGAVEPVDVEVFPTGASIEPGHRLRIAVQAFDTPHLSPTLTQLPGSLTSITIHNSANYPSVLTLPAVRR